ncbi:serine/threonine-protein kinase [Streptomyces sp. NPDC029004]|uniref:serine/threonine-protein kinase n=1 Tax=Streptomyces sp. NPDC029004 TaxID=3154490 RepID=UPI0033E1F3A8
MAGYPLLARVGEGGMGTVFLSRTRGNQLVALKVIRREYAQDEAFRRRFEQEANAARQVRGYHIVPVVDHDTRGEQPWLATTYVPGLALDEVLAVYGPLSLHAALQLTGCAAEALHAVHKAGVIHRDMKPSNILIGSQGPWVIDFGIARAADATQLTRSGGLIGTPQFMSPEHASGRDLTPATDIFSLGLIAAVAATGRHPYGDAGAITLATQIANTENRPPDLTGYPEPLRTILERSLAADPGTRPTAAELATLCEELSGRPLWDFTDWLPAPVAGDIAERERLAEQPRGDGQVPGTWQHYGAGQPHGVGTEPPGAGPAAGPSGYTPTYVPQTPQGPAQTSHQAWAQPTQAVPSGPVPPPPPGPATGAGRGTGPGSAAGSGTQPYTGPAYRPQGAAPRNRTPLVIGATALAVVVIAAAAVLFNGDDDDDENGSGQQTSSAQRSPTADSTETPTGPASGSSAKPVVYTPLVQDQPFAIRWPTTGYVELDVDTPKAFPAPHSDIAAIEWFYQAYGEAQLEMTEFGFRTPTGIGAGKDPEQCRVAVDSNALPGKLDSEQIENTLTEGAVLCTVTKQENLAMMEITHVTGSRGKWDFQGKVTVWGTATP